MVDKFLTKHSGCLISFTVSLVMSSFFAPSVAWQHKNVTNETLNSLQVPSLVPIGRDDEYKRVNNAAFFSTRRRFSNEFLMSLKVLWMRPPRPNAIEERGKTFFRSRFFAGPQKAASLPSLAADVTRMWRVCWNLPVGEQIASAISSGHRQMHHEKTNALNIQWSGGHILYSIITWK